MGLNPVGRLNSREGEKDGSVRYFFGAVEVL